MTSTTESPSGRSRPTSDEPCRETPSFLSAGGEMGALIRAHDWAATPLGDPWAWPQGLKTAVRLLLTTRHPMYVFWGADHVGLYNDAYRPSIGPEKHPSILGAPGKAAWAEIWPVIGPQIDLVMRGDGATWHENQLVPIVRHGGLQQVYWTYGFGPIDDDTAPTGVGGVLVVCTETTGQVLAERHRAAEAERLRALFAQAPGFMCVLRGPDHVFEMANAAYAALVGDRDLVGRSVRDAIPEIAGQGFLELLDRVYASGETHTGHARPVLLRRSPGAPAEERFIDFVYQPVRDAAGAVGGVFCEGSDVTASVHARRGLEASEARLATALEIAELGTFTWDTRAGVVSLDDRGRAIFGFPPGGGARADEVLGRVDAADRDRLRDAVREAGAGGSRLETECRVALTGGVLRSVLVLGDALPGDALAESEPGRGLLVGVVADVTARRHAETERQVLIDALAHDLNTPLAVLKAQSQLLRRQLLRGVVSDPNEVADRIRHFDGLANRMSELVRQLGEHARLAMGDPVPLRRRETDLVGLVRGAVAELLPGVAAHDVRVSAAVSALVGRWDARLLSRVVTNLLDNALKYSPDGGRITAAVAVEGDEAVLRVRDAGIGIPADDLAHVFDFRHRGGNVGAIAGNGIGLAGAKRIVEQHGGSIAAESTAGVGTTVVVRLPLRAADDPLAPAPGAPDDLPG